MSRGNGMTSLGLRALDVPEPRELEIVLPASAWQRLEEDARSVALTPAQAISQLIADACAAAGAPPPRSRQLRPRKVAST